MKPDCYEEGGEVDSDHLMDQCAMECIHAIEARNTPQFLESIKAIIAHALMENKSYDDDESQETV